MPHIAVLMTCHNRKEKTLDCLNLLFNQKGLNQDYTIQVYLVDDGSTDGTGAAVQKQFPMVTTIQGDGNLFWNRGMYTAWEAAAKANEKNDFYLWLNDDTNIYENAILELLSAAKETQDKAIICGCIESPLEAGVLTYGGGKLQRNRPVMNYPDVNIVECDIIHGNCVLIPKFVYNEVGNLDWKFTHAIGDHDYGLRARSEGIRSYTTGNFIGNCERNDALPKWRLPQVKLKDRINNLYSPLSYGPPNEFFVYEKRHFGLLVAIKHFFTIHLRLLMPGIIK
ncbi:glycosyltransferase family 2 protein [Mucilaginibacter robiniae]|uniref:Glycosyltransferase family 2 protein n=1 Tax=Mucilaginibacter robiniae TaxID=2728022 RepID=A0A7L5DWQ0_9SPHI|nr:glycosyltransferase family 2 protein [Mucilaginibacter robiniae]QJD94409.1 glycosyltransferase family 2 protein [Mucilaginibacter robiniae]